MCISRSMLTKTDCEHFCKHSKVFVFWCGCEKLQLLRVLAAKIFSCMRLWSRICFKSSTQMSFGKRGLDESCLRKFVTTDTILLNGGQRVLEIFLGAHQDFRVLCCS